MSELPATPEASQALGMASPMPPPPPFNTPAGETGGSKDTPAALEAGAGADAVPSVSLSNKLSGLNVRGEGGAGDGPRSGKGSNEEDAAGGSTMVKDKAKGGGEDEDDDGGEDEDELDLPPEVMKRLYELKALQSEKDVVYEKYKTERAELERKFAAEYGAIYARRADIVSRRAREGSGADGGDGFGTDDEGELGVPHFWMQCMLRHEALREVICEPDLEALYYLSDVRCVDKDDLLGFTLEFHFDFNPYFSNAVLTKRYDTANIMDQGEPLLEGVEGTAIDWKPGLNLCEKTIKRRVKRGGSQSESRVVTKTQKTHSFFKFFQNPVMYDEEEEEDEDEYNFSFDMDYEVARIFRNHLIPNAVLWYTGEAVSDEDDDEEDEEYDEGLQEEEEDEQDDEDEEGAEDDELEGEDDNAPGSAYAPPNGTMMGGQ